MVLQPNFDSISLREFAFLPQHGHSAYSLPEERLYGMIFTPFLFTITNIIQMGMKINENNQ